MSAFGSCKEQLVGVMLSSTEQVRMFALQLLQHTQSPPKSQTQQLQPATGVSAGKRMRAEDGDGSEHKDEKMDIIAAAADSDVPDSKRTRVEAPVGFFAVSNAAAQLAALGNPVPRIPSTGATPAVSEPAAQTQATLSVIERIALLRAAILACDCSATAASQVSDSTEADGEVEAIMTQALSAGSITAEQVAALHSAGAE